MLRIVMAVFVLSIGVSVASAQKPCFCGGQSSMRGSPISSPQMTGYRVQSNSMQSSMMATQLAYQQQSQLQTAVMLANASANGFQNALRAEAAYNKKKQQNAELRGNR